MVLPLEENKRVWLADAVRAVEAISRIARMALSCRSSNHHTRGVI